MAVPEMDAECLTPTLHPLLEMASAALEHGGVRWCLLRWPANPVAPAGDVDLLVHPRDIGRLPSLLAPLGLVRFPGVGSGWEQVFLAYHAATDCWIRLHFVAALAFGSRHRLRTEAEEACLERRVRAGTLAELAAEDAFWATLLHVLLDKGAIAPRHRDRLQKRVRGTEPGGPLRAVIERVCPRGWDTARLLECVRRGDWDELEQLAPNLASAWRKRGSFVARIGRLLGECLRLPARMGNHWRRRGLSVALLGPDGAGKSTLAAGLQQSFFCPVRTIYMGFGVSGKKSSRDAQRSASRAPLRVAAKRDLAPGRLLVLWRRFLEARYHQLRAPGALRSLHLRRPGAAAWPAWPSAPSLLVGQGATLARRPTR